MSDPKEPQPDTPEPPTQPPVEPPEEPVKEPQRPPPVTALTMRRRIVLH
jgi:hypothetical protein